MGKKTRDLAALAGLAGLAYAYNKGKDKEGPSATAEEKEASKVRMDAQKNAVSGNRVTNKSSYTGTTKNDSNVAKNIGFGGGDDSDKNLKRVDSVVKPKVEAQVDKEAKVNADAKTTSVVPGGAKKRTEGNEPMPSLKAVESRAAARKASISTDAMRNASRKTAAANPPKSKTPPAPAPVASKTPDAPTSTDTTNQFKHDMPITRFFKGIREAGEKDLATRGMKRGGSVKMASGGMTASRRADGIATKGKTRGKIC